MECLNGLVNDRTAENVVRPNPNGSAKSTERSAKQFGRTFSQKYGKIWTKKLAKYFGKKYYFTLLPFAHKSSSILNIFFTYHLAENQFQWNLIVFTVFQV